ncbi:MAG: glutathione peroxidase [Rhodospirillaceae bacterium]|nr:glutathione peroxidase [Rhodospirillaceae bacterium]
MSGAQDFTLPDIGGGEIRLKDFAGEAVLLVNTASECGFTPQYRDLENLWRERKGKGLVVIGVPSNDFGAQEPGTDAEIAQFCERNFAVSFPMAAKQTVIGAGAHPLYRWIAAELGEGAAPKWNFHKYLIGPDGQIAGAWPSKVSPTSAEVSQAIDAALGK